MRGEHELTIQDVSRVAYGKVRRLELMMALLRFPGERVCQKDVIDLTGASPDTVRQMFVELEQLEMLEAIRSEPGMRNKYFRCVEGIGWDWARHLHRLGSPGEQVDTLW